jgi:hypothetical protein
MMRFPPIGTHPWLTADKTRAFPRSTVLVCLLERPIIGGGAAQDGQVGVRTDGGFEPPPEPIEVDGQPITEHEQRDRILVQTGRNRVPDLMSHRFAARPQAGREPVQKRQIVTTDHHDTHAEIALVRRAASDHPFPTAPA